MSNFKNRYRADDDDDDDSSFEEFMEMTEVEQERELQSSMREFSEWWASLTPAQIYRSRRRSALAACISYRYCVSLHQLTFLEDELRKAQRRLVKLRMWHYHGIEEHADQ